MKFIEAVNEAIELLAEYQDEITAQEHHGFLQPEDATIRCEHINDVIDGLKK